MALSRGTGTQLRQRAVKEAVPFGERLEIVSGCPLFQALDNDLLVEIARKATYWTYRPGETLYHKGEKSDSMLLVVNGLIRESLFASSGREVSLNVAARGDSLGETALTLSNACPRETDYIAVTYTRVLKIQRHMLPKSAITEISPALNILLKQRMVMLLAIVEELTLFNLESRLAKLFCRLDQQPHIPLHQLHQGLLASMANATRPKVNQHLKKLHDIGAIQLRSGQVISIDRDLLESLVESAG